MNSPHPLEQPFGAVRFVIKSMVVFGGILALVGLLKDFSEPIDRARAFLYARWWGVPVLFAAFLPVHLIFDVIQLQRSHQLAAKVAARRQATGRRKPPLGRKR